VGLTLVFPWKSNMVLAVLLTLSMALGKGVGGFLADKFGWIKISVGGLALSAVFLFFSTEIPVVGLIGVFLFNLTMPVTLVAISNILPGRPGFSFGLTTFALVLGALPTFYSYKHILSGGMISSLLILFSTLVLFVGLKLYNKYKL
jgi:FSR family fosmidomycin resistance protein-like MFS transporter